MYAEEIRIPYSIQHFPQAEGTPRCGPLTEALKGLLKMTWPDLQMKNKYAAVWTSVMGKWEEAVRLSVLNQATANSRYYSVWE